MSHSPNLKNVRSGEEQQQYSSQLQNFYFKATQQPGHRIWNRILNLRNQSDVTNRQPNCTAGERKSKSLKLRPKQQYSTETEPDGHFGGSVAFA